MIEEEPKHKQILRVINLQESIKGRGEVLYQFYSYPSFIIIFLFMH